MWLFGLALIGAGGWILATVPRGIPGGPVSDGQAFGFFLLFPGIGILLHSLGVLGP